MSISDQKYHRKWYRKNRDRVKQAKKLSVAAYRIRKREEFFRRVGHRMQCIKCPEKDLACLDFHHRDPSKKEDSVARLLKFSSVDKAVEESEKCDVLCANCHRKLHFYEL